MDQDVLTATVVASLVGTCIGLYFIHVLHKNVQNHFESKRRLKEQQDYVLQIV